MTPPETDVPALSAAPSPADLRAELQQLIFGDLHGPAGGSDESLPGRGRVRDRYLIGMLAPVGTIATDPARDEPSGVEGDDNPADETPDDPRNATINLFPSAIGLTVAVTGDTDQLRVTASWGHYVKEDQEVDESDASGDSGPTAWQRYPMEGAVYVDLVDGELTPATPVAEQPDVALRGRGRRCGDAWLVSLFLVNGQDTLKQNKDEAWLFQPQLAVEAGDGGPVFIGRDGVLPTAGVADLEVGESALLDVQYRRHVEFAVGHGVAVHTTPADDDWSKAVRVETAVAPTHDVPVTEAPSLDDPTLSEHVRDLLGLVELDMAVLAGTADADLPRVLTPLLDAYTAWLASRAEALAAGTDGLDAHQTAGQLALEDARACAERLRDGVQLLADDPDAAEAFRFANRAMWQQRVHTVAVELRRGRDLTLAEATAEADADSANHRWRPFQLGFILLNLPALTDPTHEERSAEPAALLDLLFFPTGGGKTESYLGLTAYTLAIRRLQGTVAGRDGRSGGVAVLMRYTLRLLTAQQFQRAAALICACELARRQLYENDARWGETPFRLGMWVGGTVTPNRFDDAQKVLEDARTAGRRKGGRASPLQIVSCPWCGERITANAARADVDRRRVILACPDPLGECPFTEAQLPDEGLPVVTVDEELYRLLPAFVIATADKFAQLPWQGPLHLLFGKAARRCTRHGYRSADLDSVGGFTEADKHRKTKTLPAAETVAVTPLRPPDLIIQDELHLITGPLGTMVGLYETAIDSLASWQVDGQAVRPKVVASTATIRRAAEQARALFWRGLAVFPPPVLDVEDSFFAKQRPTAGRDGKPGRRYVGICAHGRRLKEVEARVFTTVLAASQLLFERYGEHADPWMTTVGYFNALRELGGAKRLIDDEVQTRLKRTDRRGLAKRNKPNVRELTSRMSSSDIPDVLEQLGVAHDPASYQARADKTLDDYFPIDVLLATNMISVGVDVARLGLMTAVGQPKATAEYIQATSRVGRSAAGPGLVFTIYNWARPRDLSHYETFEHYHDTFYRHVEALSVTPASPRALDRGLTALLVALVRHGDTPPAWNPNSGAHSVDTAHPKIAEIIDVIAQRAGDISGAAGVDAEVRMELKTRLGYWAKQQATVRASGAQLGYKEDRGAASAAVPLLRQPELVSWDRFTCANSLRETEPNVQLILDPHDWSLDTEPPYTLGAGTPPDSPAATTAADEDLDEHDPEVFA